MDICNLNSLSKWSQKECLTGVRHTDMKQDVIGFLALAAISVVAGLGLNQFRAKPLPLVYQTPAERLGFFRHWRGSASEELS